MRALVRRTAPDSRAAAPPAGAAVPPTDRASQVAAPSHTGVGVAPPSAAAAAEAAAPLGGAIAGGYLEDIGYSMFPLIASCALVMCQ